jgi:protein ImuB
MRFACIHIPDFPLQAVVRHEPELSRRAGRSVVITDGKSEAVIAADQAARDAGVRLGMIGLQVAHFPSLEIRPRSLAQEESAHAALLDLSFSFSPRVEDTAADALTLDLEGLERVWGSPRSNRGEPRDMAHRLREQASELGLDVNVAVAPNPDAALLAARGFAGITLIDSRHISERFGPLPVSILAPSDEILETLGRWGIRTLAALAALPTEQLSERLGQPGVRLQQLARGAWPRPLIPAQPALRFEEAMELEYDEKRLDPLLFLLGRLLGHLCARLTARGLAANELRLVLELAPQNDIESCAADLEESRQKAEGRKQKAEGSRQRAEGSGEKTSGSSTAYCLLPTADYSFRLPVPMRDPRTLLKLLQLNLSAHPPSAPVRKISIAAEPAKPRVAQGGFFAPVSPDPEKLEITLARIQAIVGEENSGSAELPDTHRPAALRMARFEPGSGQVGSGLKAVGSSKQKAESRKQKAEGSAQPFISSVTADCLLPTAYCSLRLFRPPLPAEVETGSGGTPTRVFFSGIKGNVVSAAGPWRSSGDWWTEESWAQDEWDVEIRMTAFASAVYRIYRDAARRQWFVRGYYD